MEFGQGTIGVGEIGGTTAINGTRVNNPKYRPEYSVGVAAAQGLEQHHPICTCVVFVFKSGHHAQIAC